MIVRAYADSAIDVANRFLLVVEQFVMVRAIASRNNRNVRVHSRRAYRDPPESRPSRNQRVRVLVDQAITDQDGSNGVPGLEGIPS